MAGQNQGGQGLPGDSTVGVSGAPQPKVNAPTPDSVIKEAQKPPDPLRGGGGQQHGGRAAPAVHIEHYHVEQTEDRAGQDLARWQMATAGMTI